MPILFQPWQLLSVIIAGMLNEQQQRSIEYLREENRVLRQQLGKKRIRLTDDQRRRLAAKGKALGRKLLAEVCTIVSPETVLRWHHTLIARKYDGSGKRIAAVAGAADVGVIMPSNAVIEAVVGVF